MIVTALMALNVQAELLLGWDYFGSNTLDPNELTPDHTASGCSGFIEYSNPGTQIDWKASATTSTDGTYGTMGSGAGGAAALYTTCSNGTVYADFSLTNNTGASLILSNFCFDVYRASVNSPDSYTLSIVGGDLTLTNDFATGGGWVVSGYSASPYTYDFPNDVDVDLSVLSDRTLADGESVVFRLSVSDSTPTVTTPYIFIDNIGIFGGTIIPESSTMSLVIIGMAGTF